MVNECVQVAKNKERILGGAGAQEELIIRLLTAIYRESVALSSSDIKAVCLFAFYGQTTHFVSFLLFNKTFHCLGIS